MKYILVPTDFSESANHASELGIDLARVLDLPIRFLHNLQTPVNWSKLEGEEKDKYPETKENIHSAKEKLKSWELKATEKNVEADHLVIFNTEIADLKNFVEEKPYKMIIMGTHGTKGFEKIMGSNTQKLIRHSKIPVLAIKYQVKLSNLKKTLIATDLQEESQSAFQEIYGILEKLDTKKEMVYINTPYNFKEHDEIENNTSVFLEKSGVKNIETLYLSAKNEARGIGMAINKLKPDLFTSISSKRSGFNTIFSPSITEEIINNYDIPVLSINRKV